MIEAVGTLSNATSVPRASAPARSSASSAPRIQPSELFVSSRIRVDNELDMAIIEIRSQETGDIIRQYPTESQIRAFVRASEIQARDEEAALREALVSARQQSNTSSAPVSVSDTPATSVTASPSVAADVPSTTAVSVSGGFEVSAPQAQSTQSVTV
jgi:hypothetical protein